MHTQFNWHWTSQLELSLAIITLYAPEHTFEHRKVDMTLTISEASKICDERDQQLHFETEAESFALWFQNLRLILILLEPVSKIETDTETFGMWSQSLRPSLRAPWSQSRDQSLAHLWWMVETNFSVQLWPKLNNIFINI